MNHTLTYTVIDGSLHKTKVVDSPQTRFGDAPPYLNEKQLVLYKYGETDLNNWVLNYHQYGLFQCECLVSGACISLQLVY